MTPNKLLSRLLKMNGFRVTWLNFISDQQLHLGVKPHKTGSRCPHCGRRCKIVSHLKECRSWEDIVVCGRRCIFFMLPRRLHVRHMVEYKSAYRGQRAILV